jgi:hypothetical protein
MWPAGGAGGSSKTVYVDCGAAPGGDGSPGAPVHTITAALPIAEASAALYATTIDVRGTCSAETFPIDLDEPVHLRGHRLPKYDSQGFPLPDQWVDTVIVGPAVAPPPAWMLRVRADGARVSRITLDGQLLPPPDGPRGMPPSSPGGILVQGADGFVITGARVTNMAIGIRTENSSGSIVGNYVLADFTALALLGGGPETTVTALNNWLQYRNNGIAVVGGIPANPATGTLAGTTVTAHVWRNAIVTSYTETGPNNPAAVRLNPMSQTATDGDVRATLLYNHLGGPGKYSYIIHAGPQVTLTGGPYTGTVQAAFYGNELDDAASASADALITFTNSSATIWPDPRYRPADYMRDGLFDLWHDGALDAALVDHPQFFRGVELGNVLLENGEAVPYGTFVVVP